jgi:hypothetical protein
LGIQKKIYKVAQILDRRVFGDYMEIIVIEGIMKRVRVGQESEKHND